MSFKVNNTNSKTDSSVVQRFSSTKQKDNTAIFSAQKNMTTSSKEIAEFINQDICAKKYNIIPTTAKEIEQHIQLITPENVLNVIKNYKKDFGESLNEAINSEIGLDKKIKEKILSHINKCLAENNNWSKPNSHINKIYQGEAQNCFLLASISSVLLNENGKKIIRDTIHDNEDGTYTVKFKGADKEYRISALELVCDERFSYRDNDVKLLEIAANKHFKISGNHFGGLTYNAMDLILGTNSTKQILMSTFKFSIEDKDKLENIINNKNNIVTAGTSIISVLGLDKSKSYAAEIIPQHAYSVSYIDDKYVYLKNPYHIELPSYRVDNTTIRIPIEDFRKYFDNLNYVTIENSD